MSNPGKRPPVSAAERRQFPIGARVRYRPGNGTYGYEDCLEADGRLAAVVAGYSPTRIRLTFLVGRVRNTERAVDAASLRLEGEC